ncbi:OmpP1/FadL family transporter [Legionella quinlivanii]|uniref:OmpP1/FadL family transporter n=1 Tax=Legionella quinlivanii TaxID=45073 RepID=UPI002242C86B|nr:outer membrane protein transport protein [Legionella quinlivanii]MCW8450319.1 outer membrane protein transport protein [Legionella quinlivanii]
MFKMRLITISILNTTIIGGLTLLDSGAYASGFQRIIDFAYDNPAIMNHTVKKAEATIGNNLMYGLFTYKGQAGSLYGRSDSKEFYNYPYGRLAYRFHPKWMGGIDVTHLSYTNIVFPVNSVARQIATSIVLQTIAISPRLSYLVTKSLAVGLALNFDTTYKTKLDNVVNPNGELKNHSSSREPALGWGVGISYAAPTKTTIDLSYFSKIVHPTTGSSTWGTAQTYNYAITYPLPAIANLGVAQKIQEKWLVKGNLRYQWWDTFDYLNLRNTALGRNILVPEFYNNTWIYTLAAHYQTNDKLGFSGGVEYNQSPQSITYRNAGLAVYRSLVVGGGFDYAFTKALTGKFIYGHAFSNPPIDRTASAGLVRGKETINSNNFDFTLTWHI